MAITETFTESNGTQITSVSGGAYVMAFGSAADQVVQGNALELATGGSGRYVGAYRTGTYPANQYSQGTMSTEAAWTGSAPYWGLGCRMSVNNFYMYQLTGNLIGTNHFLAKMVATTVTQLGSNSSGNYGSLGTALRIDATGTTITPTMAGSQTGTPGAQTDSDIASGNPGISAFHRPDVTTLIRVDNYEFTDAVIPDLLVRLRNRGSRPRPFAPGLAR